MRAAGDFAPLWPQLKLGRQVRARGADAHCVHHHLSIPDHDSTPFREIVTDIVGSENRPHMADSYCSAWTPISDTGSTRRADWGDRRSRTAQAEALKALLPQPGERSHRRSARIRCRRDAISARDTRYRSMRSAVPTACRSAKPAVGDRTRPHAQSRRHRTGPAGSGSAQLRTQ